MHKFLSYHHIYLSTMVNTEKTTTQDPYGFFIRCLHSSASTSNLWRTLMIKTHRKKVVLISLGHLINELELNDPANVSNAYLL